METAERGDTVLPSSAQHQIEALRTAIDVRLAALEAILADPTRGDSLEGVILDLSRLAAEEAHAAAVRECVGIRLEADTEIAQIRKTLQAALDQERTGAAHLRQGLERADQRIATLERERAAELRAAQAQFDAKLADERSASSELTRAAASLEQQLTEIRQRFESERTIVTGLRQSLERAEEAQSAGKRELEEARASRDAAAAELTRERELRARLENVHAQTQEALDGERSANADLRQSAMRLEQERKSFNLKDLERRGAHDALAAELTDARKRRDALTSELTDLRKRYETLTHELTHLRQRHDALASEAANDHQRRDALSSQLADQHRHRETLTSELVDERQRVTALASELEDGQKRFEALQRAHGQLEAQLASERADVAQWLQRLKEADERAKTLTRQRSDDQAAHDRLLATLDEERKVRADLQRSREDLLMQLEASRAASAELSHALEHAEHRLSTETTDTASETAGHEELQRVLAATNTEARALRGERDALRAELETLRRDQEATRTEVAALRTERESLRTGLDGTRADLDATRAQLDATRADVEGMRADVEASRSDLAKAGAELDAARSDRDQSQRSVAALEGDLQSSRDDLEGMQAKLQAARSELEITHADLTLSRTEIDELIAARESLERTRQVLEDRLSTAAREPAVSSSISAEPREAPKRSPKPPGSLLPDIAPASATPAADPDGWVPVPLATRHVFPDHLEIRVNGGVGLLCDLSATGCQLLLSSALKPNLTVKLVFPSEAMPIACTGKVVWAQLEPPATGRPLYYRAGVRFTKADAADIEAFIARQNL